MSSSISSSERRFATLVVASLGVTLLAGCWLLVLVFFQRNYQVMAVEALGADTEVLAFGSSRVFFGLDPRKYPRKTVGLDANFLDLACARDLWHLHQDKVPNVRLVLLEFSMATLFYDTRVIAPYGLHPLGLKLWPTPGEFLTDWDGAFRRLLAPIYKWRLTPAYLETHRQILHSPQEPQDAVPGYIPSQVAVVYPDVFAKRKIAQTEEQLKKFGPEVSERNLMAVKALITELNARKTKVALVRFPNEPALRALFPAEWHEKVAAAERELRGLAYEYWDLTNEDAFVTTDFRDPDHLNEKGATKLAELLTPKLEALLR